MADVDLGAYRQLAVEIVLNAMAEFQGRRLAGTPPERYVKPLTRIRRRIEAGEFLLERTDAIAALWFQLSGSDRTGMRRCTIWPHRLTGDLVETFLAWPDRLTRLREERARLVQAMTSDVAGSELVDNAVS